MKIILVYASVGKGHFKAAEAIYGYFRKTNPNLSLTLIDALDYSPRFFKNIYINSYFFMVSFAPWAWALGFYLTFIRPLRAIIGWLHSIVNRLILLKFERFLIKENPDCIIVTHFLPLGTILYLKKIHKINSRLLTIITDFGVHPFWLSAKSDIYLVASDFTKEKLAYEGVSENKIMVSGIPIEEKFLADFNRSSLLKKFNLQDKFTVLIVTGSFGIGPIEKIVDLLREEVQMIVVCANNKRLHARLNRKNYPDILAFGFVDNIEELMAVSDMIITKPGGLTISEILAMELVPIFISAIPGQETTNIRALGNFSIGLKLRRIRDIKDIVLGFKNHPEQLNKIKENIRKIKRLNTLREIYDVVCQGGIGDTG